MVEIPLFDLKQSARPQRNAAMTKCLRLWNRNVLMMIAKDRAVAAFRN